MRGGHAWLIHSSLSICSKVTQPIEGPTLPTRTETNTQTPSCAFEWVARTRCNTRFWAIGDGRSKASLCRARPCPCPFHPGALHRQHLQPLQLHIVYSVCQSGTDRGFNGSHVYHHLVAPDNRRDTEQTDASHRDSKSACTSSHRSDRSDRSDARGLS